MNELQMQQLLRQSTLLKCTCGHGLFKSLSMIRKVSKLLIPGASSDLMIPVQVLQCEKCGAINKDFLPEVLPNVEAELGIKKIIEYDA